MSEKSGKGGSNNKKGQNCECYAQISVFMMQAKEQLDALAGRIGRVEEVNRELKKTQEEVSKQNWTIYENILQLEQEKLDLEESKGRLQEY